jgi:D-hydroxyproline dehydrogenase subunit beta
MFGSDQQRAQGTPSTAVVVGAGFVGAATAYYLAKAGVNVTLVDRDRPGSGATGASAGYISMITRSGSAQLELAHLSNALYAELATELDNFDLRQAGALLYYFEDQVPLIEGFVARRRADGLPMDIVDADRARELCPILPDDVVGGIHSHADGSLHAQKLVDALAAGVVRLGGRVESAEVVGLEVDGGRCTGVRTADGHLAADVVAVTAGSWSAKLLNDVGAPLNLFHIRLQGADTQPIEERFDVQLYGPTLFHEYEFVRDIAAYDDDMVLHPLMRIMPQVGMLEAILQRADGRLLLGCPIEFVDGPDAEAEPTVAGLAHLCGILGDHVPGIQQLRFERAWAGIASQTGDGLPVMDAVRDIDGLFIGAGHAYGATVGSGSGKVLADLMLGRSPEIDMQPFRYDRPAVQERSTRALMYG